MSAVPRSIVAIALPFILLFGSASPDAGARKAKPIRRPVSCAIPRGARLVGQDSLVRIVVLDRAHSEPAPGGNPTSVYREWRYCLRSSGRFHRLVISAQYGGDTGNIVQVQRVLLAGQYVAYSTETLFGAGRYGDEDDVYVRDLRSGHGSHVSVSPADHPGCGAEAGENLPCNAVSLVLSPQGVAAWHADETCIVGNTAGPCAWGIQALDGSNGWHAAFDTTTLDQTQIVSDPFAHLQLYRCQAGCPIAGQTIATWTRAGIQHSATVH